MTCSAVLKMCIRDRDVDQLLADTDAQDHADDIKNWYDGYHFGDFDVYCPWDVMNYLRDLQRNSKALPSSCLLYTSRCV